MSRNQRLASFGGPSTPTKLNRAVSNPPSPAAQRSSSETTYHRKLRAALIDFRLAAQTWRELVHIDGFKAAKTLIDTRTDLENTLKTYGRPQKPLVAAKLNIMEARLRELDVVLQKMQNQREKIHGALDNIELLINDAHRAKGWEWVSNEALWCTWPMDKFYQSLLGLMPDLHRSLEVRREVVSTLKSHDVSFERSKEALQSWSGPTLDQWDELEELFSIEVDGWPTRKQ